jgi:hypothetical protein
MLEDSHVSAQVLYRPGWLILILLLASCAVSTEPDGTGRTLSIPDQSDWIDYGRIFENGAFGEWDYQLWGGFTGTV